jgi:hypothetical protein
MASALFSSSVQNPCNCVSVTARLHISRRTWRTLLVYIYIYIYPIAYTTCVYLIYMLHLCILFVNMCDCGSLARCGSGHFPPYMEDPVEEKGAKELRRRREQRDKMIGCVDAHINIYIRIYIYIYIYP